MLAAELWWLMRHALNGRIYQAGRQAALPARRGCMEQCEVG